MNENDQKLIESKKNFKAGFYTLIIFVIILFIWGYTNPLFKKKQVKQDVKVNPELSEKVNSLGESFKTTWSTVSNGIKSFKK